jgi:hypothetical protein
MAAAVVGEPVVVVGEAVAMLGGWRGGGGGGCRAALAARKTPQHPQVAPRPGPGWCLLDLPTPTPLQRPIRPTLPARVETDPSQEGCHVPNARAYGHFPPMRPSATSGATASATRIATGVLTRCATAIATGPRYNFAGTQKCRRKRNEHDHPSQRAARLLDRALYTKSLPPDVRLRPPRSSSWRTALPARGVAELEASLGLTPPVAKVEAAPVAAASEEPVDEVDAETARVDADAGSAS